MLSFECSITATMKKKYEIGKSMLAILKDIAMAGYDFRLSDDSTTVVVGEVVGLDRRKSVQYISDSSVPQMMNITDITASRSVGDIANYVLTKIASSPPYSVEDAESIAKYGRIEKYITVNADDGVTPSGYLAKHKNGATDFSFVPIDEDYLRVGLGDIVSVAIAGINPLIAYEGIAKVTEKSYRSGDLPEVRIAVSTGNGKGKTLRILMQEIDARVSALERRE